MFMFSFESFATCIVTFFFSFLMQLVVLRSAIPAMPSGGLRDANRPGATLDAEMDTSNISPEQKHAQSLGSSEDETHPHPPGQLAEQDPAEQDNACAPWAERKRNATNATD
jgi:hypothetical protein